MAPASFFFEQLVRDTQKPEAEVMALATEAGLRQLWREHLIGRYLRGELTACKPSNRWESTGLIWRNDSISPWGGHPVGPGIVVRAYHGGRISLAKAENCVQRLYDVSSLFVAKAIADLAMEQLRQLP